MTTTEQVTSRVDQGRGGWRVVAAKELADHLYSGRFVLLLAVLAIATAASVFAASGR